MLDRPAFLWFLAAVAIAELAALVIVTAVRIARDFGWL